MKKLTLHLYNPVTGSKTLQPEFNVRNEDVLHACADICTRINSESTIFIAYRLDSNVIVPDVTPDSVDDVGICCVHASFVSRFTVS